MRLSSEEQRAFLLQLIDNVPIQGSVGQLRPFAAKVQELKTAIAEAPVEHAPHQEMMLGR